METFNLKVRVTSIVFWNNINVKIHLVDSLHALIRVWSNSNPNERSTSKLMKKLRERTNSRLVSVPYILMDQKKSFRPSEEQMWLNRCMVR